MQSDTPRATFQTPKMNAHTGLLLRSNCNMPTHAGRHVHGSLKNQILPHHSAINRVDNTSMIALRPPSSLTTELEPRIQSPSNTQSRLSSRKHSATNRLDDISIAPRPPSRLTTELEPPPPRAQDNATATQHSQHNANNHHDQPPRIHISRQPI